MPWKAKTKPECNELLILLNAYEIEVKAKTRYVSVKLTNVLILDLMAAKHPKKLGQGQVHPCVTAAFLLTTLYEFYL